MKSLEGRKHADAELGGKKAVLAEDAVMDAGDLSTHQETRSQKNLGAPDHCAAAQQHACAINAYCWQTEAFVHEAGSADLSPEDLT